jgi:hypothetical protein
MEIGGGSPSVRRLGTGLRPSLSVVNLGQSITTGHLKKVPTPSHFRTSTVMDLTRQSLNSQFNPQSFRSRHGSRESLFENKRSDITNWSSETIELLLQEAKTVVHLPKPIPEASPEIRQRRLEEDFKPTETSRIEAMLLLELMGVPEVSKLFSSCKDLQQVASLAKQYIVDKENLGSQKETFYQGNPQDVSMSILTQSPNHLMAENKRLKATIHRLQSEKRDMHGVQPNDKIAALEAENQSLRSKIADMVDLIRKRDSYADLKNLFASSGPNSPSAEKIDKIVDKDSTTLPGSTLSLALNERQMQLINHQRDTIENLQLLLANSRQETNNLQSKLKTLQESYSHLKEKEVRSQAKSSMESMTDLSIKNEEEASEKQKLNNLRLIQLQLSELKDKIGVSNRHRTSKTSRSNLPN